MQDKKTLNTVSYITSREKTLNEHYMQEQKPISPVRRVEPAILF